LSSIQVRANIQWHFNEAKSDFASLQPGQVSEQDFVITLSTDNSTTTIPVKVTVYDADVQVIPVSTVPPAVFISTTGAITN
jgi:VCBS repeat-containing protein